MAAYYFGRAKNIPVVTSFHRVEEFREQIYKKSIEHQFVVNMDKWICETSDKLICVSKSIMNQVISLSGRTSNVHCIPNGINIAEFPIVKPRTEQSYNIVFVGRLVFEKGLDVLLDALY